MKLGGTEVQCQSVACTVPEKGACLSMGRWLTFSIFAAKVVSKLFLTNIK
jgi:hypothetical protein